MPLAMTIGGVMAIVPDLPRIWREDFTSLPFAATLGSKDLEVWLHSVGDLFFMHRMLDAQPNEFALHGLAGIVLLYNLCAVGLLWSYKRSSKKLRQLEVEVQGYRQTHSRAATPPAAPLTNQPIPQPPPRSDHDDPVLGRIG